MDSSASQNLERNVVDQLHDNDLRLADEIRTKTLMIHRPNMAVDTSSHLSAPRHETSQLLHEKSHNQLVPSTLKPYGSIWRFPEIGVPLVIIHFRL